MYQGAVAIPVARAEQAEFSPLTLHLIRRFLPFVWMSVWTILVTGTCMMLFSPRFVFLEFHDRWSVLLACKQVLFVVMVVVSFGYSRMFSRVDEMMSSQTDSVPPAGVEPYYHRMNQFARINVVLALATLLLASSMA